MRRLAPLVLAALLPFAQVPPASATPTGTVFAPNPVATLQDQSLTDQKDADYPALQAAYRTYYWATQAQVYLQELGFSNVNNEPQRMKIDQYGVDNSYYNGAKTDDVLRFGKGGVDDAEVILHEYGHAIQDSQVPGFGTTNDSGSIGEGFGDYWAQAVSARYAPTPDQPCIADWDAISYTRGPVHCLRRTDGTKTYPADLVGEVHMDGEIWSSALNGMRTALGATRSDTAVVRAQFSFRPDISMPAAARVTIATVKALYGAKASSDATAAFHARGLA